MPTRSFVRASIAGIVYLIDSQKGRVYTYDLENPTYIGDLERIEGTELTTSEGNLTGARLKLREDWTSIIEQSYLSMTAGTTAS